MRNWIAGFLLLLVLVPACSSSSGTVVPSCYFDSDCDTGQQCKNGECTSAACATDDDCRGGASCQSGRCERIERCTADSGCNGWFCVAGSCVQCKTAADCAGGLKCLAGVCRLECQSDGDCRAPAEVCDPLSGVCVGCLDDGDCQAPLPACDDYHGMCVECMESAHCGGGKTCRNRECVEVGCTGDGDCSEPTPHCNTQSGECVQCLESQHCPSGQICVAHACQPSVGCNGNGDCTGATPYCNLQDHICVECLENSHCPDGYHCANYSCAPGECDDAGDCPQERPYCNTETDPSRCVQCLEEEDCANQPEAQHCLLKDGICVRCFRNAHCPDNATCSVSTHTCLGGFTACQPCVNKRCQLGATCAQFIGPDGSTTVDSGCVHTCWDSSDCAKGYYCSSSSGGGTEGSCLPAYNRNSGTCEAIRDIGTVCQGNSQCGVSGMDDAVCLRATIDGICTIPCKANSDCPGELVCEDNPLTPTADYFCSPR